MCVFDRKDFKILKLSDSYITGALRPEHPRRQSQRDSLEMLSAVRPLTLTAWLSRSFIYLTDVTHDWFRDHGRIRLLFSLISDTWKTHTACYVTMTSTLTSLCHFTACTVIKISIRVDSWDWFELKVVFTFKIRIQRHFSACIRHFVNWFVDWLIIVNIH